MHGDYNDRNVSCQIRGNQVTFGGGLGADRGFMSRASYSTSGPQEQLPRFVANKKTARAVFFGELLMEMAGIEPASEKFDLQTSTSLVDLFKFGAGHPDRLGQPALSDYPRKGVYSRDYRHRRRARRH